MLVLLSNLVCVYRYRYVLFYTQSLYVIVLNNIYYVIHITAYCFHSHKWFIIRQCSPTNKPATREGVKTVQVKTHETSEHQEVRRMNKRKKNEEEKKNINPRGDVVSGMRGWPHPRKEGCERPTKSRGLLSDGAACPCRRQRPPPHLSFHLRSDVAVSLWALSI